MAENILEMRHVTKAFGGIKALKDVSIDLPPARDPCHLR